MKIAEVQQILSEREKLVARINHLKGQPVIASTKAVAAANTAVPAAKP